MKRTAILLFALILGLVSTSSGQSTVFGDFENGLDGFEPESGSTLSQSTTGATLGDQALEVDVTTGGWQQIAKNTGIASLLPLLGNPGAKISIDVTASADDVPAGWLQLAIVYQGGGPGGNTGWTQFGTQAVTLDGAPQTLTWELSDDQIAKVYECVADASWWGQFFIIKNTGEGSKFYMDKIQIVLPGAEDEPKSTDLVIGNFEQDLEGWVVDGAFEEYVFNDTNGVTLGDYSLDLWTPENSGWQNVMELNLIDANLVDAIKNNTKLSIDVTTLVANWPESPQPGWNEVCVQLQYDGEAGNFMDIIGKRAGWRQSDGDVTETAVFDYSDWLPRMNYLEGQLNILRFVVVFNVGNYEGPVWRYLDNIKLYGGGKALEPNPANEAKDVHIDTDLSWRGATSATSHHLYLGTDAAAVAEATEDSDPDVMFVVLEDSSYTPEAGLEFMTEYFWRVDEVNDFNNPDSPWTGDLWNFTTADFISIDDFEDYNDSSDDTAIWSVWTDGWLPDNEVNTENGAIISTGVEEGGNQSMMLEYDNSVAPASTTSREWAEPQDWTFDGINPYKLTLSTKGLTSNKAGELNVTIKDADGGSATVTALNTDLFTTLEWTDWELPLSELLGSDNSVDLTKVTKLTISVTNIAGADKAVGFLYIDDIRGYTPVSIVLEEGHLVVPKSMATPVIDGQWDAAWNDVNETEMLIWDFHNADSAEPENADDLSAIFKAFYDADNFYLFVEINDSVINAGNSSWQGDGIEIYFDGDYSHGDSYDGINDNQIRITVDDVDISGVDHSLPIDGTEFKVLLTDKGYNIEVAFPLEKLQIYPSADPAPLYDKDGVMIPGSDVAANNIIGFELQINDNDLVSGDDRESMLRWYSNDNTSWSDPSLFGQARMAGTD